MVASPAALFASRPSDRPSLLCLFVRRLSGTSPSLVRVVDPSLVFLLESSLSYRCLVASPLGSTGHCVRFGSAVQFYTPRGTAVRFYTPRGTVPFDSPCAHSYSICWLRLAATLFTHTLSHAWCPVTLLSLTCCPTVVVTVVAARLPPSIISVTVQHRITVQCSAMQCNAVHCTAPQCIAQAHSTDGFCVVVSSFWSPSGVLLELFERRSGS